MPLRAWAMSTPSDDRDCREGSFSRSSSQLMMVPIVASSMPAIMASTTRVLAWLPPCSDAPPDRGEKRHKYLTNQALLPSQLFCVPSVPPQRCPKGSAVSGGEHGGVSTEPGNPWYREAPLTCKHIDAWSNAASMLASLVRVTHLVAHHDGAQEGHVGSEGCHVSRPDSRAGPHVCAAKPRRIPQRKLLKG